MPDPTTPRSAPVYMPDFQDAGENSYLNAVSNNATYENTKAASLDTESPDSGHKEMSSESLSFSMAHSDTNGWSSSPTRHFAPRNPFENNFNPTSLAVVARKDGVNGESKIQVITPLPPQDASGNRLDLKMSAPAPRIDPPPRVQRSSRSVDRSERGSWYGGGGGCGSIAGGVPVASVSDANASFHPATSDSDYYSTYASSNGGGVTVTYRAHSHNHRNTPNHHGQASVMRYSDSSARSSFYSDSNRESMASLSALRQKLDLKVNDLNYSRNHQSNGRWKMRISYTSDDNSDNSDEMNTTPSKEQPQKLELSGLEEFDTLCT